MDKSLLKKLIIIGCFLIFAFITASGFIGFSNREIGLKNTFSQKLQERTAFYDKMRKVFNSKSQIAVKNDSSFRKNINIIMDNRKDSEQVLMKWVTETNPNANYQEVSALYKDLSRTIEAQREGFFFQEKTLTDIVRQHNNHLDVFPNSFYNLFFSREHIKFQVIKSDETEQVMKTGKDNTNDIQL